MGQVLQAGVGQAPARQAVLRAGLPVTTSATTINRVCGSGLKAIMLAAAEIRAGDAEVVVAGGMENMNLAPYLLPNARFGYRLGDGVVKDATVLDGLWCAIEDCHMGTHAERVAAHDGVSRADQDALRPREPPPGDRGDRRRPVRRRDRPGDRPRRQGPRDRRRGSTRARAATRASRRWPGSGRPSPCPSRRPGEPAPGAARSPPATRPGITDGAAATVVASERAVERLGLEPLARIVGYAQAEVEPKWLFLAPVDGVRQLLERIELPIEAFDLVEINEAFAAQVLADGRELGFDWSKVNVNGGAIALGHPIGASGARIVATLLHELRRAAGPLRPGDALPGRRRLGRDGLRAGVSMTETADRDPADRPTGRAAASIRLFIGGEWVESVTGRTFESREPGRHPRRHRPLPGRRRGRRRAGDPGRRDRPSRPGGRPRPRSAARSSTASARSWPSTRSASPGR